MLTPGYDAATRLLLIEPPPMPDIPDAPTREQALDALALLESLLVDFPFVDEVAKSVALSALISPVVRGAFAHAPMPALTAPVAGSGKSYLLDVVAAISSGQYMPVISASPKEEELEKRLGAAAIAGQPLISIDNLNGELRGDLLCQLVERPVVYVRPLGLSKLVRVEPRAMSFFADGNNLVVAGDMTRRSLLMQMDPKEEEPELREFSGKPFETVLADRGKFVAACLTLCRAYCVAGRPGRASRWRRSRAGRIPFGRH
jgi:putative DNA primase/helicase